MRYSRVVFGLGVVATAVLLGACGRNSSPGGAILRAAGDVEVAGVAVPSDVPVHLRTGDLVNVRVGQAVVTLPNGAHVELRDASTARFGTTPTLVSGDLLADSPTTPQRISTTIADVIVQGVARLHRDLAVTVRTYQGTATITALRDVVVPALAEDTAASASLALPEPGPLHLDASDGWDQRYMAVAIELTRQIDSQSTFVNANAPKDAATSVAFYTHALKELAATPVFNETLLRAGAANSVVPLVGDRIMAAAIALSGSGDFAARWRDVFALRSAGAQWGIIVLAESADSNEVLTLIEQAVTTGSLVPAPPPPTSRTVLALPPFATSSAVPAAQAVAPVNPPQAAATGKARGSSKPPGAAQGPSPTTMPPNPPSVAAPVDTLLQVIHNLLPPPATR